MKKSTVKDLHYCLCLPHTPHILLYINPSLQPTSSTKRAPLGCGPTCLGAPALPQFLLPPSTPLFGSHYFHFFFNFITKKGYKIVGFLAIRSYHRSVNWPVNQGGCETRDVYLEVGSMWQKEGGQVATEAGRVHVAKVETSLVDGSVMTWRWCQLETTLPNNFS